jgi:tetratricopeptide (TPR) repeat protein
MKRLLLVLALVASAGGVAAADREAAYRANNLGVALLEQFKFAEAAAQFRSALAIDPLLALARINLALALFYQPDLAAARVEAEAAWRQAPAALQPPYLLALIARLDNREDEAIAHLQRVLAADAKDAGANLLLGQIYQQQRKLPEAVVAFRVAVAAEPYNASTVYNLGLALTRLGQQEEGTQLLARFSVLRESGYKTSFGQTYLEQGRYAEAVASTGAEPDLVDRALPAVSFVDAITPAPTHGRGCDSAARSRPRRHWRRATRR